MEKDRLTTEQLTQICEGYDTKTERYRLLPSLVAALGKACYGLMKHPKSSPDWEAHYAWRFDSMQGIHSFFGKEEGVDEYDTREGNRLIELVEKATGFNTMSLALDLTK